MTIAVSILLLLAAVAGAAILFARQRTSRALPRVLIASLALSAGAIIVVVWGSIASSPMLAPNSVRLTPTIAMTRGLPLYADPATGVMSGGMDGPLTSFWLLPAAIAKTPTNAVTIGATIELLTFAIPLFWIALVATSGLADRRFSLAVAAAAWSAGMWIVLDDDLLRTLIFTIGAETISTGFIFCSIALMMSGRGKLRIVGSGFFTALSLIARPATIPIVVIVPICMLVSRRNRDAILHAAVSIGLTATVYLSAASAIGFRRLWFHLITLPMHPAWGQQTSLAPETSAISALTHAFFENLTSLWPVIAITAAIGFASMYFSTDDSDREPASPKSGGFLEAWWMLPITAAVLWPAGVWAGARLTAPTGTPLVSGLFLVATTVALLARLATRRSNFPAATPQSASLLAASIIALWLWPKAILTKHHVEHTIAQINQRFNNPQEIAFSFEQRIPGKVFFPWSPLSILLADGKLYSDEPGLLDRAGLTSSDGSLTPDSIRSHLPAELSVICIPLITPASRTLNLFPKVNGPFGASELPMFAAYTQADQSQIVVSRPSDSTTSAR